MTKPTRLFDFPYHQLAQYPQENCLVSKKNNQWSAISTQQYLDRANEISRALLHLGVQPNDKIAIITTNNDPKWHMLDIGILQIGAQNVPLYPTFSEQDYEYILNHSDAVYCFVSDAVLYDKVQKVIDKTQIKALYTFQEIEESHGWNTFLDLGSDMGLQTQVDQLKSQVKGEDLATIIYTSGTTGTPKGVLLTHHNIVHNVFATGNKLDLHTNKKRVVSYLPVCHIFERAASYYCQYMGFEIHFAESIDKLGENLKEIKPNFMAVVPRLLEKVFDKIVDKGSDLNGIKKNLFFWALALGERYKPYKKNGFWYESQLQIANKIIFSKWRDALGGQLEFMLAGSAPMQDRLVRVFTAAQIPVFEGYGMTETSPAVSVADMRNNGFKIGTVGKVIDDVEVKIAEDGEILVKGPNIMKGYYKDDALTHQTIVDGYLHTGDIGELDKDGFLKITDRKKEMFKTSGGKYIAPAYLEANFKKSRFIEQIMVIGEGQKMPAALIQPNMEFLQEWARRHDYQIENLVSDTRVIARIQKEIDHFNQQFGRWEQIKKFEITPDLWTIEAGHLTPTLKMRRKAITKMYQHLIDKIYTS
ncbi:AMP-dependent synthetase [Polaribacter pacificus]|uniref:AMP-dependent synthetase n=1 Tax=Polaribacter pacificus TaxID=1775173 RepID=A0A917I1J2_9FLAO|nr:long-chain fatty acid--CoA ligase [Polaribacter pacificus]GGH03777.1 AMP-dependent synthetase [Polaribacter pacificus]